jgi:aspartyl-tRNA synthetase
MDKMEETFKYYDMSRLNLSFVDQQLWIRGRVHTIRNTKTNCFLIIRENNKTLQAIAFKKSHKETFKELCLIESETIVDLYGILRKSPIEIESTTYKNIEFEILKWNVYSPSERLPFLLDDANDTESKESFRCNVGQALRLDYRWLDLRTPYNQSIFRIKSGFCRLYREYLYDNDFIEIQSPKLIGNPSESGSQIFKVDYFGKEGFLAQSPQLYKQLAINSDFNRVFEVGPVFRAENSFTGRHLCEFTGLDLEMVIPPDETYNYVLRFIWGMLIYIFDGISERYKRELEVINSLKELELPKYRPEPLIIPFSECVKMLNDEGFKQEPFEDFSTETERAIGKIVKRKYGIDLFIIDKYPTTVRPFYTMRDPNDNRYSYSYDIIFRCQEISSGAQRVNDHKMLLENVAQCDISQESLNSYLKSFSYGSKPHAGCGIGLERLVSFFLDLDNVRKVSLCPRDPKRLTP